MAHLMRGGGPANGLGVLSGGEAVVVATDTSEQAPNGGGGGHGGRLFFESPQNTEGAGNPF